MALKKRLTSGRPIKGMPKGWKTPEPLARDENGLAYAKAYANGTVPKSALPPHPFAREYPSGRDTGWNYVMEIDLRDVMLVAKAVKAAVHNGHTHPIPEGVEVLLRGSSNFIALKTDYDEFRADRRKARDGEVS